MSDFRLARARGAFMNEPAYHWNGRLDTEAQEMQIDQDDNHREQGPTTLRVHLHLGGIAVYTIRDNKVWEPNEEIWIPLPEYVGQLADNVLDAHSDVVGFEVR